MKVNEKLNQKGTVLYDNSTGTNSSISIPTINDYDYIDVCTSCNDARNTTRIYKSNYNEVTNLISIHIDGGVFIIYCNNWKFTGTTFSRDRGYYLYMIPSGVHELSTNNDSIKIVKIVGYKL